MSAGLPWDQLGGSTALSFSIVLSENSASGMPISTARSAAITPGPPPLVMIASRLPRGRNCVNSALAAAKSWPMLYSRITPARRSAASKTASSPKDEAECDSTARDTSGWRPALISSTGLTRAAPRSALMKRRASRTPSTYRKMLSVRGSEIMKSSTSPKWMSDEVPSETTAEKPTLFGLAQSRIAAHSAPDCEIRPIVPFTAPAWAKVALRPSCGRIAPKQLGPSRRMRCRRAASMTWRSSRAPRGPASEKPADSTMTAFTPARPQASTTAGVFSAGMAITARSSRCGTSSIDLKHGTPCTCSYLGLMANSLPL